MTSIKVIVIEFFTSSSLPANYKLYIWRVLYKTDAKLFDNRLKSDVTI